MQHGAARAASPKVLDRALAVLDLFGERRPEWTMAELAEGVGLPISTTYRIVRALESHGLVRQAAGRYRLGVAAIALGHRASSTFDLRVALRGELERLAAETHETVTLSVFDRRHLGALCVDRIEAPQPLRLSLEVGSVVPLHAGAASKALLAFLGSDVLEAVLAGPLPKLAPGTITDPATLREEIERVGERGLATSFEETNAGAWGTAAPVLSAERIGLAVLGTAGPTMRHSRKIERTAVAAVVDAARRAAALLGVKGAAA